MTELDLGSLCNIDLTHYVWGEMAAEDVRRCEGESCNYCGRWNRPPGLCPDGEERGSEVICRSDDMCEYRRFERDHTHLDPIICGREKAALAVAEAAEESKMDARLTDCEVICPTCKSLVIVGCKQHDAAIRDAVLDAVFNGVSCLAGSPEEANEDQCMRRECSLAMTHVGHPYGNPLDTRVIFDGCLIESLRSEQQKKAGGGNEVRRL